MSFLKEMAELSIGNARLVLFKEGIEILKGIVYMRDGIIQDIKEEGDFEIDAEGRCMIPGLIDPHTHLVFSGRRTQEFEKRLKGKTYEEIAAEGGGILFTVQATRETAEDTLFTLSLKRVLSLLKKGITTVEIKSGYGLDISSEMKILKVIKRIEKELPLNISKTFLGAHAFPLEYKREEYVEVLIKEMLPKAKEYAEFCDVFCDRIAFSPEESLLILEEAKKYGMRPKIHADELSYSEGAEVAARVGAVSADHLVYSSREGLRRMKENNVTPVLLPATSFFLGESKKPDLEFLREEGINFAIGSDFNPGSSPYLSPFLVMHIGCIHYGLTIEESIKGMSIWAAKALGIEKRKGSIEKGKDADLVILDTDDFRDIIYMPEYEWVLKVIINGEIVYER